MDGCRPPPAFLPPRRVKLGASCFLPNSFLPPPSPLLAGVKLGASYFLPNSQIGTFGAITPIKGLVKSFDDLWDVAFAGPLAGGAAAVAVFLLGFGLTMAPDATGLIPVPAPLFQGSLLLGALSHAVLGEAAFHGSTVAVHPFVIAGWCGIVSTSLNLLPVGQLDGGRLAQGSYGKGGLQLSSFFTYVGLALGIIGSSLGASVRRAVDPGLATSARTRRPDPAP